MQTFAFVLLTLPIAQAQPKPPPVSVPAPRIETIWDSRGDELTSSNGFFENQATLKVRVSADFPVEQGKLSLFLNGSTKPEDAEILFQAQGQIVARLKRVFRRGEYTLSAGFAAGKITTEVSKPASFRVDPPEAPQVQAIYEGPIAVPFKVEREFYQLEVGSDVNVELGGTLPGDVIQLFMINKGFPEEIVKRTVEDKPLRDPINVDFSTITGVLKGKQYTVLARIVRGGDASDYARFNFQIGLKPDPCDSH